MGQNRENLDIKGANGENSCNWISETLDEVSVSTTFVQSRLVSVSTTTEIPSLDESRSWQPLLNLGNNNICYEELYIRTDNLNNTSIKKTNDPNLLRSIKTSLTHILQLNVQQSIEKILMTICQQNRKIILKSMSNPNILLV